MPAVLISMAQQATNAVSAVGTTVGTWVLGVLATFVTVTVIAGIFLRGLQAKYGDAYITGVVEKWNTSDTARDKREAFIKKVLDDQVHRDDGVVRTALSEAVASVNGETNRKLDALLASVNKSTEHYQQMLQKLAHIEGSVDVMKNALKNAPKPGDD